MKKPLILIALTAALASSAFAQAVTPAPAGATPAAQAPAPTVNAICKDGTAFNGSTLKGACHGHGGVDKKAMKTAAAPGAPAAASAGGTAPAKADSASMAQAPGGGAGKVWANDTSKVYHCQGDKFYGKTKHGEYMSEADAKAKGFHGAHGKACA